MVFTLLERDWSLLNGFYFTLTTMATIGYGDLSLESPLAWEFWYFFIFYGVSLLSFLIEGIGHDLGHRVNRVFVRFYLQRLDRKLI